MVQPVPNARVPVVPAATSYGPGTVTAPHVILPIAFGPAVSFGAQGGIQSPPARQAGTGPITTQPRAIPQWLQTFAGWFSGRTQNNIALPVTAGFTGGPVSTVPGILGGVQGFTLPPGAPNSVQSRF